MDKKQENKDILDSDFFPSRKTPPKSNFYKFSKFGFLGTSLILWIGNLICFHYWYRASKHLGWWPSYMRPDPKELGWDLHHSIVSFVILLMVFSAMLWLVLFLFNFLFKDFRLEKKLTLLGVVSFTFTCYLSFSDFLEWFID